MHGCMMSITAQQPKAALHASAPPLIDAVAPTLASSAPFELAT
jgi:hypothetical protein